ncbi:hypothetical protein F01_210279 [Burkholderia cenocepacia]|nr:hypothetical protein F01_210279 [Burkholderia cenocepacia]
MHDARSCRLPPSPKPQLTDQGDETHEHPDHAAARHDDHRRNQAGLRSHPDARRAGTRRGAAPHVRAAPPGAAAGARRADETPGRRRAPRLPGRDEGDSRRRLEGRAAAGRPAMPPGRDHGPRRAQDDHQRAELGRRFVHDGLRGFERAELDEPDRRPDQPEGRGPPHDLARTERQVVQAERQGRDADRASARLAPRRKARDGRRPARVRRHLRFRAVPVPQREGTARARVGPVLLPAEDGKPSRGAPVERHLRRRAGSGRRAARHDPRDGADRDDPRRVRDGRDPVRTARTQLGPERRPLGLHLLGDQEVQERPRLLPGRPLEDHDDGAVHAGVRAAAAEDLPQAQRAGDRRDERADPDQERSGSERQGDGRRALGQAARRDRRLRRRLGRAPGPRADRDGRVRQGARRQAEPDREAARRRAGRRQEPARLPAGSADHRSRPAQQHQRRDSLPRRVARRQRLRADPQPDGRCGDGRDFPLAGVAVDPLAEGRARRRPQGHGRTRARIREDRARQREARGRRQHAAVRTRRGDLRADVDVGRLHRIPDAAAVRGNLTRLSDALDGRPTPCRRSHAVTA